MISGAKIVYVSLRQLKQQISPDEDVDYAKPLPSYYKQISTLTEQACSIVDSSLTLRRFQVPRLQPWLSGETPSPEDILKADGNDWYPNQADFKEKS